VCAHLSGTASNTITETINERWLPSVRWSLELRGNLNTFHTQEFELNLAADAEDRKPREQRLNALQAEIQKVQAACGPLAVDGGQKDLWDDLQAHWVAYLAEHAKIRKLALEAKPDLTPTACAMAATEAPGSRVR